MLTSGMTFGLETPDSCPPEMFVVEVFSELDQQTVQISQRRHRHARRAELHPGAGDRVEHPRRHDRDHAGGHLDVHEATGEAILAVVPPDAPPVQRMPAVVNHDLLPDMGRMTP